MFSIRIWWLKYNIIFNDVLLDENLNEKDKRITPSFVVKIKLFWDISVVQSLLVDFVLK